jgi:outer membrane protein
MKNYRLIAAAALLVAFTALPAFAQGNAGRPAAPAQSAPAQANVPDSKIALVNTEAFSDEKQGITRLVNAVKGVEREFDPRKKELQGLQQRITTLQEDITKETQLADMKKDFQRRGEDAQAAYNKRMQEAISPIYDDIGKALDAFAKQRGITLLLDASKIGPAILSLNDGMDITLAFIREFNTRNPATAAAAGTR